MSKVYSSRRKAKFIQEFQIPDELAKIVELYDKVISICGENYEELKSFILNYYHENPKEFYFIIFIISNVWMSRAKYLDQFTDLIKTLNDEKPNSRFPYCFLNQLLNDPPYNKPFFTKLYLTLPLNLKSKKR